MSAQLRIKKLTPEQEGMLAVFRDNGLRYGLSTERINHDAAKRAVCLAYECAGLAPPSTFVFLPSPLHGAMGAAMLSQVWAQVEAQVWAQVEAQVRAQVGAQVGAQVWRACYGQHDAGWFSWAAYLAQYLPAAKSILGLYETVKACGWWWPFQNAAIITDRPRVLSRDDRNRLHSETGPALAYEGWDLHFWHGVKVGRHVVEHPEAITVDEIKHEENAEVRRVLIERMTPEKYLRESGATLIDSDFETARKGAAARALLRDGAGDQWLVGTDGGTKRVYYMPVPREVKTCREAHVAICGFDESRILAKS